MSNTDSKSDTAKHFHAIELPPHLAPVRGLLQRWVDDIEAINAQAEGATTIDINQVEERIRQASLQLKDELLRAVKQMRGNR